jgi:hypothetical protein
MHEFFANAGATVTVALGLMGLFTPTRAAAFVNVEPIGLVGKSEIRATYGGLFVGLGLVCLVTQLGGAFLAAGFAWVGAAAGRLFSVAVDGSRSPMNLGGIVFELAIGGLLLSRWFAAG